MSNIPNSILIPKVDEKSMYRVFESIKIIDNEGDPDWCVCNGKNICNYPLKKAVIFEYKKRNCIELEYLLKKNNTKNIKKIMKYYTSKKFKKQNKSDLIREIIVYFYKLNWKKQKQIIKNIKNNSYKKERQTRKRRCPNKMRRNKKTGQCKSKKKK